MLGFHNSNIITAQIVAKVQTLRRTKCQKKYPNNSAIHSDSYGPLYDVVMSPEPRNSSRSFSALFWSASFLLRRFVCSLSLLPGVPDRSEFRSLCLRCFRSDLSASCKYHNKMLSYRRETALQGALQFSPKVEDWNWETIFYGHYRSIFNHCDEIGLKICRIP